MKCELPIQRKCQLSCSSLLETSCSNSSLTLRDRFKGQSTRRLTDTSGHDSSAIILIYSERWPPLERNSDTIVDLSRHDLLRPPAEVPSGSLPLEQFSGICTKGTRSRSAAPLVPGFQRPKQHRIRTHCSPIKADAGGDVHVPAHHLRT